MILQLKVNGSMHPVLLLLNSFSLALKDVQSYSELYITSCNQQNTSALSLILVMNLCYHNRNMKLLFCKIHS